MVRATIAKYQTNCQMNPRFLKFRKNVYGKPEVKWQNDNNFSPPPLYFNISHTSSMISYGVTMNVLIGIDVEKKQRKIKNNIITFAQHYFSPYKVKLLTSISDPEVQCQELIKLWTLKAFEVIVESSDDLVNLINNWKFGLLEVGGSHYAAICMEKDTVVRGETNKRMKLTMWKTIPFVEDVCVSGTDSLLALARHC
ncbi:hypothetical protein REPUB_Repub02eG0219300 [Reevesia pubescens]